MTSNRGRSWTNTYYQSQRLFQRMKRSLEWEAYYILTPHSELGCMSGRNTVRGRLQEPEKTQADRLHRKSICCIASLICDGLGWTGIQFASVMAKKSPTPFDKGTQDSADYPKDWFRTYKRWWFYDCQYFVLSYATSIEPIYYPLESQFPGPGFNWRWL